MNSKKENLEVIDEDKNSVSKWFKEDVSNIEFVTNLEPIDTYMKQIKEMEDSYKLLPKEKKRTKKIYNLIVSGKEPLPIYVEKNDDHNFILEGRHRIVAFLWLGLKEIKVTRVQKKFTI